MQHLHQSINTFFEFLDIAILALNKFKILQINKWYICNIGQQLEFSFEMF